MAVEIGPLFVVGNSRSGTTLVSRILGLHDQVFTFRELHFFEQLWTDRDAGRELPPAEAVKVAARLLNNQRRGYFHRHKDLSPFLDEARAILDGSDDDLTAIDVFRAFLYYEAAAAGASIPCEQTPRNLFYIREILDAFPAARVVIMVRDPRAVLLSQKGKWRRRGLGESRISNLEVARAWFNYHPMVTSRLWNSAIDAGLAVADHSQVTTIRFEDLATEPEGTVRDLCEFAKLDFQPAMLQVPQRSSSNEPDSEELGIKSARAGQWRHGGLSDTEVFLCERITRPAMERFGYESTGARPNPVALVGLLLFLPLQLAGAFALNLGRIRNLVSAIRRRLT